MSPEFLEYPPVENVTQMMHAKHNVCQNIMEELLLLCTAAVEHNGDWSKFVLITLFISKFYDILFTRDTSQSMSNEFSHCRMIEFLDFKR